jgi:uncharacterized protein (TIGR02001 family)
MKNKSSLFPSTAYGAVTSALLLSSSLLTTAPIAAAEEVAAAEESAPASTFTGHLDWTTKYILRGVSETYGNARPGLGNEGADAPESDDPAVQWGVDYIHASGWYVGYWASQINYSYKQLGKSYSDRSITDFQKNKSIENDLYGGYSGRAGDFTYTVGVTGYYYYNSEHSNAFETKLGLAYGQFGVYAQTLLGDTVWGNEGDTYWTAVFTQPLPDNITLTATLGYYTYTKEGKYLGTRDTAQHVDCAAGEAFVVNGCYAGNGPSSSGFRHFIVAVSQPIADTGLVWGVQGLLEGENRFGISQSGAVVGTVSYTF